VCVGECVGGCLCVYIYVCVHGFMYRFWNAEEEGRKGTYVCVYMYVCICVYVYVCVCV